MCVRARVEQADRAAAMSGCVRGVLVPSDFCSAIGGIPLFRLSLYHLVECCAEYMLLEQVLLTVLHWVNRCIRAALARCILASGLSVQDRNSVRSILDEDEEDKDEGGGTPLVVFTPEIADKRVGDVLTDAPMIGLLQVGRHIFCMTIVWLCSDRCLCSSVHPCLASKVP